MCTQGEQNVTNPRHSPDLHTQEKKGESLCAALYSWLVMEWQKSWGANAGVASAKEEEASPGVPDSGIPPRDGEQRSPDSFGEAEENILGHVVSPGQRRWPQRKKPYTTVKDTREGHHPIFSTNTRSEKKHPNADSCSGLATGKPRLFVTSGSSKRDPLARKFQKYPNISYAVGESINSYLIKASERSVLFNPDTKERHIRCGLAG